MDLRWGRREMAEEHRKRSAPEGERRKTRRVWFCINPRSFVVSIDGDPGSRLQLGPFLQSTMVFILFYILYFWKRKSEGR